MYIYQVYAWYEKEGGKKSYVHEKEIEDGEGRKKKKRDGNMAMALNMVSLCASGGIGGWVMPGE